MRTLLVHLADQRRDRTDSHGIIGFSLGLVRALPGALRPDERLVVLGNPEICAELGDGFLREGDDVRQLASPANTLARLRLDHAEVLRVARAERADVVLYPKGFLPVRPLAGRRVRQVPCLHDDIPTQALWRAGEPLPRRVRAAYFTGLLRWSMRTADRRLFVSEFSASQLWKMGGGRRAGDAIVGEGISMPRLPLRPLATREPQAVVFGSSLSHKRTAAGLQLMGENAQLSSAVDRVVVVGVLPDGVTRVGALSVDHRPGPLETSELAHLLATSRLLVFPSEYEGFGLPPIEALAMATPVVFRRTEASAETLHGAPGGYGEETASAFAAAMAEALALGDDELAVLSNRMWDTFDWSAVAARVAGAVRS